MRVGDLSRDELESRLAFQGLKIHFGPFVINIRSDVSNLASICHQLYCLYTLADAEEISDFHVQVKRQSGLRRWVRPQCRFMLDGRSPFAPYSLDQALPALEWGINWCIATRSHHLLMLHSAVVERGGLAILLPAWPGHGKSTLCTALIHSGWRLLSDEFGLVRPLDGKLLPLPRLIPLKNESIEVIRGYRPQAHLGPTIIGTRKGDLAYVRPPEDSLTRWTEPAKPRWLIFPRWMAEAPLTLQQVPKSQAFFMVATNAFNFEVLDQTAFQVVTEMVAACDTYSLVYSNLDEAISAIDELTRFADE